MSEAKLSRKQRREMQRLAAARVDKASQSDRLFFERHPDRKHRIRNAHTAEILQAELSSGEPHPTPPGWRWFSVIRNICPNARGRLFMLNREDAETDLTKEVCRQVYEWLQTPRHSEVEEKVRATMCGEERT